MSFSVIFDMDGVIIDNGYFHFLAWQVFCEKYSIDFSEHKFKNQFFGKTNQQVLPELFGKDLTYDEIIRFGNEKELIFREIYAPEMKPLTGLISFLIELKSNHIKTAVATSAPPGNVSLILNGLSLHQYFDTIIDDSMVLKSKPDPEIYLKAAKSLNEKPQNCVVFEDSLAGTKAARDAGCKVVALTTTLPALEHKYHHYIITDFTGISVNFIQSNFFN